MGDEKAKGKRALSDDAKNEAAAPSNKAMRSPSTSTTLTHGQTEPVPSRAAAAACFSLRAAVSALAF